jgi:hypothetical protein
MSEPTKTGKRRPKELFFPVLSVFPPGITSRRDSAPKFTPKFALGEY